MNNQELPQKDAPKPEGGVPGNPKYVDCLDEDPIISNQRFCCISFAGPLLPQYAIMNS